VALFLNHPTYESKPSLSLFSRFIPAVIKKEMKIFRQVLETDSLGFFLADAIHDNGIIQSLTVFPIRDGVVGERESYTMHDLPNLTEIMQANLTDCLTEA
jgi:hypothetical protein